MAAAKNGKAEQKKDEVRPLKTVVCRGARIRYSDTGKGRAIVLLHGFLESLEVWNYNGFADELAKKFRVIAIDLPGHGKSDCLGYVHRMERMADVVKDVMDQAGLRRYVIAGHSMGGYVALAFAEKYPEFLRGLCLFHSTALADSEEKQLDRERAIRIVKRSAVKYTHPLVTNLFALANVRYMKKEITWLRRVASRTRKQGIVAALEGMKIRRNREPVLKFAQYPVLIIAGKRDNVIPFHTLEEQASLPKTCRLLALDRVGHMGFIEARELTLQKLRAFTGACYKRKFSGV
ncbi:MAG: alpha/beta hydrolase [Bacteroidetes bacterium]|nr:alpha/beta hydrolase [Bacteroidota bacterium]